jgi:hypothetical protein
MEEIFCLQLTLQLTIANFSQVFTNRRRVYQLTLLFRKAAAMIETMRGDMPMITFT